MVDIAPTRLLSGDERPNQQSNAKGHADGLIRVFPDSTVGGFCAFDGFAFQ
jgi:hypothetical protein